jgi:hypothetical protein
VGWPPGSGVAEGRENAPNNDYVSQADVEAAIQKLQELKVELEGKQKVRWAQQVPQARFRRRLHGT